jgi:hypothetical protein
VAKRTRGAVRPGQRRTGGRPPTTRSATTPASGPESQLEAAPDIAEDLVEARPRDAAATAKRVARTLPARRVAPDPAGILAARAATEYVYVAQDVRRIVSVASVLLAVMLGLWLLIEVFGVVRI